MKCFMQCFSASILNVNSFILLLQKIKAVNVKILSTLEHTAEPSSFVVVNYLLNNYLQQPLILL